MHGHAQIQYHDGETESLIGFDPFDLKDLGTLHSMLDEFVKNHVQKVSEGVQNPNPDLNFFTVSGYVD